MRNASFAVLWLREAGKKAVGKERERGRGYVEVVNAQ